MTRKSGVVEDQRKGLRNHLLTLSNLDLHISESGSASVFRCRNADEPLRKSHFQSQWRTRCVTFDVLQFREYLDYANDYQLPQGKLHLIPLWKLKTYFAAQYLTKLGCISGDRSKLYLLARKIRRPTYRYGVHSVRITATKAWIWRLTSI